MGKIIQKSELNDFLNTLTNDYELIAPIKTDIVRYDIVEDPDDINLTEMPYYSFKKYLQPSEFKIADIKDGALTSVCDFPKRVIFGARLCDLSSVIMNDKLFLEEPADPYYKCMRENTIFIGIHCSDEMKDEYCFCDRVNITNCYDLYFYDLGDAYYIDVGSQKGETLVKNLKKYDYTIPFRTSKKNLADVNISEKFDDPIWDSTDANAICLGCGTCTIMCPTCLCFSIKDDINLDLATGARKITWDSCQLEDFTKVAGNEVFREPRLKRFKHRIYHKIQYFKDKYAIPFCTGCGRCMRYCPTKIRYIDLVDALQ